MQSTNSCFAVLHAVARCYSSKDPRIPSAVLALSSTTENQPPCGPHVCATSKFSSLTWYSLFFFLHPASFVSLPALPLHSTRPAAVGRRPCFALEVCGVRRPPLVRHGSHPRGAVRPGGCLDGRVWRARTVRAGAADYMPGPKPNRMTVVVAVSY